MPATSFGRRPRAAFALVLATLFVLTTAATSFAAGGGITQISSDRYKNSSSQHKTEVEPDTFSFGSTIVSAFQAGRFFDGGSSNVGWATSTDNGSTWKSGFLPGTTVYAKPKGTFARQTDPAVAYDAKDQVWLIVSLGLNSSGVGTGIVVSRSTDGGLTWNKPVTVVTAQGSDNLDKTWIVCDNTSSSPFYGNCYVEFDNFGLNDLEMMDTSTDGGLTWATPMTTGNSASGIGGQPVVQPNGTVIVPLDDEFESSLQVFSSKDGGKSWSSTTTITTFSEHFVAGSIRAPDLISGEIDKSGKVYVVFYDCRFENGCSANDILLTSSKNGITWSTPVRVPADPVGSGVDHFLPSIGIDHGTKGKRAHLVVTYYYYPNANCDSSTCQLDVGYVSSTNGGKTWSTSQQLAGPMTLSWLANTNQGVMVGDYFSTSFAGGKAFPVIANATAPNGNVFNEGMYTSVGLNVLGGNVSSDHDRVVASHPISRMVQRAY